MGVDLHELRRRSVLGQHCSNDVGNMLELSWWSVFPRGRLGVHELRSWHMVERHPGYFLGNLYRLLTWDGIGESWRDKYLLRLHHGLVRVLPKCIILYELPRRSIPE